MAKKGYGEEKPSFFIADRDSGLRIEFLAISRFGRNSEGEKIYTHLGMHL